MNKYAAIDIGTNSMRILIADVEDGKIKERTKEINPTRIGASVDKEGMISEVGIERNIEAFHTFVKKAKEYGAEKIWAVATSAVRDAQNGGDFIQRAFEKTGIYIQVISGEKEAELGYIGVAIGMEYSAVDIVKKEVEKKVQSDESKQLVIDIGGGSTELILGDGPNLLKTISLNMGAVRMTERYITTYPISHIEIENIKRTVVEISKDSISEILRDRTSQVKENRVEQIKEENRARLIGIGGTITTLASLHQELEPYDSDKVHNYKLTKADIAFLVQKLQGLTVEEIKAIKGIHPKRADIIGAGAIILHTIMENLGAESITVSEYDNLEGLVHRNI